MVIRTSLRLAATTLFLAAASTVGCAAEAASEASPESSTGALESCTTATYDVKLATSTRDERVLSSGDKKLVAYESRLATIRLEPGERIEVSGGPVSFASKAPMYEVGEREQSAGRTPQHSWHLLLNFPNEGAGYAPSGRHSARVSASYTNTPGSIRPADGDDHTLEQPQAGATTSVEVISRVSFWDPTAASAATTQLASKYLTVSVTRCLPRARVQ